MAPNSWSNFVSYLTGWLTTLAWQSIGVSISYITATLLQGIIVLTHPNYVPLPWHTVLIVWAVALFAVIMNSITTNVLAKFEGLILIVHLAGFFGILIPMVYFSPHNEPSAVFATFFNEGGWSTQTLSFFVGFPGIAAALLGADCAVHMAEEIQSAALVVPRALLFTIIINGSLAFAMTIALMFCLTDVGAAVAAAETVFYPFIYVFHVAVGSTAAAGGMASVVMLLSLASSVGIYASASRMLWSFSRDRGVPFHPYLTKVSHETVTDALVHLLVTLTDEIA